MSNCMSDQKKSKIIYYLNEGSMKDKDILGEKGANLCEMYRLGLSVPSAFIISSENCLEYRKEQNTLSKHFIDTYKSAIHQLEHRTKRRFRTIHEMNNPDCFNMNRPLLVSVRSSSFIHLPEIMLTILNLGMNDHIVEHLILVTSNEKWVYLNYIKFLSMFGHVVYQIEQDKYQNIIKDKCYQRNVIHENLLNILDLKDIIHQFKEIHSIPHDPYEQLILAIEAIYNLWYSKKLLKNRYEQQYSEAIGCSVIIQSMVYGNINCLSGTGIAISRNPNTGLKQFYGLYMGNAEGNELFAGFRKPIALSTHEEHQPELREQLLSNMELLEISFKDAQEIEFTVENGTLFILEAKPAKRTARAAVCIAVSMVKEKLITEREALLRIDPYQMEIFLHPMIDNIQTNMDDPQVSERIFAKGIAGSPGAAIGKVVFTSSQAIECSNKQEACILVQLEPTIEDTEGIKESAGVIFMRGSLSSQLISELRTMSKPVILHTDALSILNVAWDRSVITSANNELTVNYGDIITIDGSTGTIYVGEISLIQPGKDENFQMIMQWADKYKRLQIYGTSASFEDVLQSHRIGGEGIGLLHTEYMFMKDECINQFRKMILSDNISERSECLLKLLPIHQAEFEAVFRCMGNLPVTIRLLDPPLEVFLPNIKSSSYEEEVSSLANILQISVDQCMHRVKELQEHNPMLGFRGCRLSIIYPEITEMQIKAIIGATIEIRTDLSVDILMESIPHIVIPFVCTDHEIDLITPVVNSACDAVNANAWVRSNYNLPYIEYQIGVLIETPRAIMRVDRIAKAKRVQFFLLNSDILTNLTMGISEEDSSCYMSRYLANRILPKDPFLSLDMSGVGFFMSSAVEQAKLHNHSIKIGIHGEHGGDPLSIHFFDRIGLDYITCHPYRIPIAKVAAAQAHILHTKVPHKAFTEEVFDIFFGYDPKKYRYPLKF